MPFINTQLVEFKRLIENAINTDGVSGKESMIRSSHLINLIHDAVKKELIDKGVDSRCKYPHLNDTKPEIKLAGFLKQKDQDICVLPKNISKNRQNINWGPLKFQNKIDEYGFNYTTNTLVINVRSQMSSLAKNADTLFERTFAEAMNLHMKYPNIVLGDVYLIPVNEYDDEAVKNRVVAFKNRKTDIEKYISFFASISGRSNQDDDVYKYEKCTLLIVDFNRDTPKLYSNNDELKQDGLVSRDFNIDYSRINFETFVDDLLRIYEERYNIDNLLA